jgi:ferredoxin
VRVPGALLIERPALELLIQALQKRGYVVVGPVRRDQAIVYDELHSVDELPAGWTDEQAPATYRLKRRADTAVFGYATGPHAWKRFLHPPALRLLAASSVNGRPALQDDDADSPRYALFGVRACDVAAIALQDRVLLGGPFVDTQYQRRRAAAFIVAVNCTTPAGTCFCASMQTGPRVAAPHDLALTEIVSGERHVFLLEVGSERGRAVLEDVPHREATPEEIAEAETRLAEAVAHMGRSLETKGLKEALLRNHEHPRWDDVAGRCLTCGNCTLACPTCFCTTVEDTADLSRTHVERWRKWDTCFAIDFSYMYGGSVRLSPRSRYRQWLTHKLATWHDQFGTSGCVGCGRCITWCPVGIDITVEAAAIGDAHAASGDVHAQGVGR